MLLYVYALNKLSIMYVYHIRRTLLELPLFRRNFHSKSLAGHRVQTLNGLTTRTCCASRMRLWIFQQKKPRMACECSFCLPKAVRKCAPLPQKERNQNHPAVVVKARKNKNPASAGHVENYSSHPFLFAFNWQRP